MHLLCGLGNPGSQYAAHRHNIGFRVMDALIEHYRLPVMNAKFHGEYSKGRMGDVDIIALKPMTFMNKSGVSVAECARFFKIPPKNIWVFYDELDLVPGKVRVKRGGGAGGHNGIRSIDQHLPKEYGRVRLGIGHPGRKEMVTGYVLGNVSADQQPAIDSMIDAVVANVPLLLADEPEKFMTAVAAH